MPPPLSAEHKAEQDRKESEQLGREVSPLARRLGGDWQLVLECDTAVIMNIVTELLTECYVNRLLQQWCSEIQESETSLRLELVSFLFGEDEECLR